jgi:hypothetical protein
MAAKYCDLLHHPMLCSMMTEAADDMSSSIEVGALSDLMLLSMVSRSSVAN